jgi:hypothetical protein
MLVCNWNGNNIKRFDSSGNYVSDFVTSITQPEGVAYLPNGNLLVGSGGAIDDILEFQADGTMVGVFASGNGLANPNAIVLRDATLSVSENQMNTFFVTPTIGSVFTFNQIVTSAFKTLEVFDVQGKHLETILLTDTNDVWNASKYNEGMYFIVAFNQGRKDVQKIVISKR